jgi:hypothetical protein
VEGGGQAGVFSSSSVFGVYGYNTSSNSGAGVFGAGYTGVSGSGNTGVAGSGNTGVRGDSSGGVGVYGESPNGYGVYGYGRYGLRGNTNRDQGVGVVGYGGYSGGVGVSGSGDTGVAGYSSTSSGFGVYGRSDSSGVGVYGFSGTGSGVRGDSPNGLAGDFTGNVRVTGSLSKGGGSFKIDHPLDPENKYLSHSFVESPDMLNVYNGNIITDEQGDGAITLPDWFEALNKDFRYQLTVIGQFAQAIVSSKIRQNRFTIKTDKPNVEVSWQVTGIRQDAWANAHRIPTEEKKPESERGRYLHPAVHGQPEEKGIELARRPVIDVKK